MKIKKLIKQYPIAFLFLLVLVIFLPSLNVLPVTIMEARNLITAREMVQDGNWILTTMNGLPRYQKPPLPTWITAVFGLIFGFKNIMLLRIPGLLMLGLIGTYIHRFSVELADTKQGIINSLIVVTSFYVFAIIIEAPWDIYAHGFMLMAIYYMFRLFRSGIVINWIKIILLIACSFLSKGPVAFFALLLPFIIVYTFTFRFSKKQVFELIGIIVIGLLLGSEWFVYVRLADPGSFLRITEKEVGNWSSYNVRPFYYYWSFFVQSGLWALPSFIGLLYPYLKEKVSKLRAYQFSIAWTLLSVVLLSVVPEKKSRYLMPVLIPLAINTGFYIRYIVDNFKHINVREKMPVYIHFSLIAFLAIGLPLVFYYGFYNGVIDGTIIVLMAISLLAGGGIVYYLKRQNAVNLIVMSITFYAFTLALLLPAGFEYLGKKNSNIAELQLATSKDGTSIYALDYIAPEMIWHLGHKVPVLKREGEFKFPDDRQFGVLVNNEQVLELPEIKENYIIKRLDRYDLNTTKKGEKRYRKRLVNDYYQFTKRNEVGIAQGK